MANEATVKLLQQRLDEILAFDRKRLAKRTEWGTISFEKGEKDFGRIYDIVNHLKLLPLDILTEATVVQMTESLTQTRETLKLIDSFTLESSGNPPSTRDQYLVDLQNRADLLFTRATPWIPFLAYQKGDVAKNIADLNSAVGNATALIGSAQAEIKRKSGEIDIIITKARDASAAAGAAVFTKDFEGQASKLEEQAKHWLVATAAFALGTLFAAVIFYNTIVPQMEKMEVFQLIAAKVAILGVLLTAAIWCGRVYKALMHQSAIYRFKALGLQTFQAFTAGAADPQTKDAVLLETTRAIFSNHQTGYIEEIGSGDTQIVEVLKSVLPPKE